MADPSIFDFIRVPVTILAALDWRPYHFAIQPVHYLVRLVHLVSMAAFFGGIGLLDFRLMGWQAAVPLRNFGDNVLPWLWVTFGVAAATGTALFLYDPIHVGSHAYWSPKLVAIGLGLANAAVFHRGSYVRALASSGHLPVSARVAGAVSLACWTAAVCFAGMNAEGVPRVLLR